MVIKGLIVNVEAAIACGNKWLIVKRSEEEDHAPGTLALVGGKIEIPRGSVIENIAEKTLHREIREEVGISVEEKMYYVESKFFFADDGEPVFDLVFLCWHKMGEPYPRDSEEVENVFWKTTDDILEDLHAPDYLKSSLVKAQQVKRIIEDRR